MRRDRPGGSSRAQRRKLRSGRAGIDGGAGLAGELAGRLDKVEAQLTEFHRRSAHRESVIDRLHEENQRLHGGIGRIILEPV